MLSPTGTLGRLPFLAGVMLVNTLAMVVAGASFLFHPVGAAHLAVIVMMAALAWGWFVLHARRLADAGRSWGTAALVALALFGAFVIAHAIVAGVWAQPQVRHEGFRTGGVMGDSPQETSLLVTLIGREIVGLMGVAGSIVVSGLAITGAGVVAAAGAVYSFLVMLKGQRRDGAGRLPPPAFGAPILVGGRDRWRGDRNDDDDDDDDRRSGPRRKDWNWKGKDWAKRLRKRRDRDDD